MAIWSRPHHRSPNNFRLGLHDTTVVQTSHDFARYANMNYKGILTEEAVVQFRKEGATFVLLSVFNDRDLIRELEVRLVDEGRIFCIAGKNSRAEAGLAKEFVADTLGGKKWYPFHTVYLMSGHKAETVVKDIADFLEIKPIELEWAFIIDKPT